jgi:hypothetical protein
MRQMLPSRKGSVVLEHLHTYRTVHLAQMMHICPRLERTEKKVIFHMTWSSSLMPSTRGGVEDAFGDAV